MAPRLRIVSLLLGLLALAWLSLVPRAAWAIEYEVFIDVDSEEELYDLFVTGQISEDTFNTLVELRRRGIDLNAADREQLYTLPNLSYEDVDAILAYRAEAGTIHAPADLVAAGVLSRAKLGSILTYVRAYDERRKLAATSGWVRYQTGWSQKDHTVPPMALQARVNTLRQLTIGVAGFVTRQRPGNAVWDPNREALIADPMQPRVNLPKYYVQWDTSDWGVIAGSYRIGFGQRLVFDNSTSATPNGFFLDDAVLIPQELGLGCRESQGELAKSPCDGDAGHTYVSRDFRWRDGLRGVAIGAKHLSLPVGWLQIYGFGSWQSRQLYQYHFYDRRKCDDPRSLDEACAAPETYVTPEDPLDPAASHKFQVLPNMYDEILGGGNFTWFHDRRTHVGVTGYGATAIWKVQGADLDFQEWAPTPFGGPWGAIGADMAWGRRWSDLTFELARSFDSMRTVTDDPDYGGGGWAALLRHTSTISKNHELEISGRYYDTKYANPFAGPISQPDQYDGNRARDEAGGRIRYGGRVLDRADIRGLVDFWVQPSEGSPKMLAYLRTDVDVNSWFRPGLWLQYRNIDLRRGPPQACITDGSTATDDNGNTFNADGSVDYRYGCLGEVGQLTGRLGFRPLKGKLSITAQYQHEFIDDLQTSGRTRQDMSAFVIVRANPVKNFRVSTRLRYLSVDVFDRKRYEESIWAYFDFSYVFAKLFLIRARYDAFGWLDQRDSTLARIPRVEHRLRFELEARF
ncbi:hypothetical protein ACNOYE_02340 [Nannocystaceae bacterium ST9]